MDNILGEELILRISLENHIQELLNKNIQLSGKDSNISLSLTNENNLV